MSTPTMSMFFAILALTALGGAVLGTAVVGAARLSADREGSSAGRWRAELGAVALPLAWLVAVVATSGSLYYSEVAHFTPCTLCWLQRMNMYPLVIVLGIATFRPERAIRFAVLAVASLGALIASYHTYIQAYPPVGGSSFCTAAAPCTERYVWQFGFVSLPFMALCGFLAIIVGVTLAGGPSAVDETGEDEIDETETDEHEIVDAPLTKDPA